MMPGTQQKSAVTAAGDKTKRAQPWKSFANPGAEAFKAAIAAAPDQKVFNVGNAALTQYAAENM